MVKFLGLYDPWRSFLDFSPSVRRPAGGGELAPTRQQPLEPRPRGKTYPYMAGQPLPADTLGGRWSSNDLNLTLKTMTLNDLILKEFGFQLKAKMEVFSKVFAT